MRTKDSIPYLKWWSLPAALVVAAVLSLAAYRDVQMWLALSILVTYAALGYAALAITIADWRLPGPAAAWAVGAGGVIGSTAVAGMLIACVDLAEPSLYVTSVSISAAIAADRRRGFAHLSNFTGGAGLVLALAALSTKDNHSAMIAGALSGVIVFPALMFPDKA